MPTIQAETRPSNDSIFGFVCTDRQILSCDKVLR